MMCRTNWAVVYQVIGTLTFFLLSTPLVRLPFESEVLTIQPSSDNQITFERADCQNVEYEGQMKIDKKVAYSYHVEVA